MAPRAKHTVSTEPAAIPAGSSFRNEGTVSLCIAAPPEKLYGIVADVTRCGERSPECRSCTWLPGPAPGTVGSRFRGHNKSRQLRWSRLCEVVAAESGAEFAFRTVPERFDPSRRDSTIWSYSFTPEGDGTRVTHSYRVTRLPLRPFFWLYGKLLPQHGDMRPQMLTNLEILRDQIEGERRGVSDRTSPVG